MKYLLIALLALSFSALAKDGKNFEKAKARLIERLDKMAQEIDKNRACVKSANNQEALKKCRESHRQDRKAKHEMRKKRRENRKKDKDN